MIDFEEPKRTEEPEDIDLDRAVEAAGAASFWSEFHDEPNGHWWKTVAVSAAIGAAVGIGVWLLVQKKR